MAEHGRIQNDEIKNKIKTWVEKTASSSMEPKAVETGIPQGSPVSPILFAVYISGFEEVERKTGAEGLFFADDVAWVATGKDVEEVTAKIEACAAAGVRLRSRRSHPRAVQIAVPCHSLVVLVAAASVSSMMTSSKRWSPVAIRVVASNGPGELVGV